MKRVLLILTLCGLGLLAATANGQDYLLTNDGTSTGGTWNTTSGSFTSAGELWGQGEGAAPSVPTTFTHTITSGTFSASSMGTGRYGNNTSEVTVGSGAIITIGNMLWVGIQGKGTLNIRDGGKVTVNNGSFVGYSTDNEAVNPALGEGIINVTGAGSTLNITGYNALWLGGHSVIATALYGKSGTLNVLDSGTVTISRALHVADKSGAGNVRVDGGTLTVSGSGNALFVGRNSDNSANTPGKATFTLDSGTVKAPNGNMAIGNAEVNLNGGTFEAATTIGIYSGILNIKTGATVKLGSKLLVGGYTANASEPRAVVNFNGGTLTATSGTEVRAYGTLNINAISGAFTNVSLAENGILNVNAAQTINLTGTKGELNISNSGARVTGVGGQVVSVKLAGNVGRLYFNGQGNDRGVFEFTSTDTTYTGFIDGYAWPLATANIGTEAKPLRLAPSSVGSDSPAEFRLVTLNIGTGGNSGYAVLSTGTLRASSAATRGIYLGDENANSNGTLVLTGGSVAGHFNNANSAGNLFVGAASGGKGRLILAGGTLSGGTASTGAIQVQVNPTGTVEIANGTYNWTGLRLMPGTTFDGALEITGGTFDTQGHATTVNALNSGSQYNTGATTGTLTNSGAKTTATLKNTDAGVYDGFAITGALDVQFGSQGQAGTVFASDGDITSTGPVSIWSDTSWEDMNTTAAVLVKAGTLTINAASVLDDLQVDRGATLKYVMDPTDTKVLDWGDTEIEGTLEIALTEPWDGTRMPNVFEVLTSDTLNIIGNLVAPTGLVARAYGDTVMLGTADALPEPSTWLLLVLSLLYAWRKARR